MIDNQVHDNWETLDPLQSLRDRGWYEKQVPLPLGRMPGNGPCPALGPSGCRLPRHRPITCTTQLCVKMLRVLKRLNLYAGHTDFALQIEDLLPLPDILPALYGVPIPRKAVVTRAPVDQYRLTVRRYRERLAALAPAVRQAAIDAELPPDSMEEPCIAGWRA